MSAASAAKLERYAAARESVEARIEEVTEEIRTAAIACMQNVKCRGAAGFSGGSRRILADRILERLALQEMLAGEQAAIECELADDLKAREYDERVLKPRRDAEAEVKRLQAASDARDVIVRAALDRVKRTRMTVTRPDPKDVEVLRANTTYRDRYTAEGSIQELLWLIDRKPWWRVDANQKDKQ